jgi:UDP-N-acetylmuramate--alanine ligase
MKIYCSGIGGIGLSAYAALQREAGHTVLGSDRSTGIMVESLRESGMPVCTEQDGSHVPGDADLFVYSEAIPIGAPERTRASELGIPQYSYPQALGELTQSFEVIAVCGTHGKSSAVAMAAKVLIEAGKDPTVVVGTRLKELKGRNYRRGRSRLFLLEACEYRRSFLSFQPNVVLMTNCDGDHFDYYPTLEEYERGFSEFLDRLPEADGIVITHRSDPVCWRLSEQSGRRRVDADVFSLPTLQTPGRHMQENAQLVLALAQVLGIDLGSAGRSLQSYTGSWRRMEVRGTVGDDIVVIDDYGHHPTEIRATLRALREAYPDRRLVCAFQPHTHDRTLRLWNAFGSSFSDARVVIVLNVYDARSAIETATVDVPAFVRAIGEGSRVTALHGHALAETEQMLRTEILRPHDLLVCMGAGDITELATKLVSPRSAVLAG